MQIEWKKPLGLEDCPYANRWLLDLNIFTIRIHHFMGPDDTRYLHDHPWSYLTIILKGKYEDKGQNGSIILGGWRRIAFRKATHAHAVIPITPGGVWTLVFTGRKTRTWGFWVNGKWKKSLRFFFDIGHPPCE